MKYNNGLIIVVMTITLFFYSPLLYANDDLAHFYFSDQHRSDAGCFFENLSLPDTFFIYAAGAYSGKKLKYQIDQSGHQATQIDVAVNSPNKAVVLMLGAYEPTIWNIGWSKKTQILAVLVSGYHEQRVAGLPKDVPILNSSYSNKGACRYFYLPGGIDKLNPLARELFGHEVDLVFLAKDGRVVVGDPLKKNTSLLTSTRVRPESFYDRSAPLAGEAGLQDAVRKGILRPATAEDIQAWFAAMAQKSNGKSDLPPVYGQSPSVTARKNIRPETMHNAYVVLKPFQFPAGLYGAHSGNFYVLKGVPAPTGNPGHSSIYDFNTMIRQGPGARR